jgi:8-oxo-dGTP pyrophosphatase MutT (NUDIX family)
MKESVGIFIIARDTNNFLLLHRSTKPIVWSLLTGSMERGESPKETILREIKEEIGVNPKTIDGIREIGRTVVKKTIFHVFVGYVDNEFEIPNLKIDENDDYGWFNSNNLPSPIHKRWDKSFQIVRPYLNLSESIKNTIKKLRNEQSFPNRYRLDNL